MRFSVCGPYTLIRRSDKNSVDNSSGARSKFWSAVEDDLAGLPNANGCYIFAMKSGGGITPWYVGKAELRNLRSESLSPHKLLLYNEVLSEMSGTPLMYLLPRITKQGKLPKPNSSPKPSIAFLEMMILSYAFDRNKEIKNKKNTKFLRDLDVVGLFGGHPGAAALDLRKALGIE